MKLHSLFASTLLLALLTSLSYAQEEKKEEEKKEEAAPKTIMVESQEVVLPGLNNPAGIAIQPETGLLFVSDSGAGRIVKFNPASAGTSEDVVTGFKTDVYGKGPMYNIGPLGLAFLNKNTLVVGGGDLPDSQELVYVFTLPEDGKAVAADTATKLGPIPAGEASGKGEGNFYGVAVGPEGIYFSSNGDDTKGWILRSKLKDGKPEALEPYIATKPATEVDAPVGITMHPTKPFLVVGQMGEINKPKDSLLTFYRATDGKMLMNLETGLFDITALAYSPRGRLYALDYAWMEEKEGGLYRLDKTIDENGKQGVTAVKVLSLDKATAMAFAPDGTLYVTVIGTKEEGKEELPGKLIKIKGDL
jgi:hypothetical protein